MFPVVDGGRRSLIPMVVSMGLVGRRWRLEGEGGGFCWEREKLEKMKNENYLNLFFFKCLKFEI